MADDPHRARRERLLAHIDHGVLLVRGRAAEGSSRNLFYLTGVDEPRAALLLAPGGVRIGTGRRHPGPDYVRGRTVRQVLFLPRSDPLAARWGEDAAATLDGADPTALGVDAVLDAAELDGVLATALGSSGALWYVRAAPATLAGPDGPDVAFVERVRRRLFGVRVEDATERVHEMRRLKDDSEVRAIEMAARVTGEGIGAARSAIRAGAGEHQIEAEIARVYRARGASHAFDPVVASGPNALRLHYQENRREIAPGELVLIDTGAALGGYRADVTRTYPVDGQFTERQREVYDAVLQAQAEAIARCAPGATIADVHAAAFAAIDRAGFGASFPHGTSHHLGLETHDPGDVHCPLEPGAVITVEPGIYIEDEGIGIRIEDDVLVTADGPRVLTESIPKAAREVETGGPA